jgi:prephenate dehydrogenase
LPADSRTVPEAAPAHGAHVGKLVVVGVGLIGGSFALALRAAGRVDVVVGIGRGQANLDAACALGVVDRGVRLDADWTAELRDADVVLVAAPVAQYPALFAAMARRLGPATIVTDAGSTKQDVIAAAKAALGADFPRFVPGHPIAGTEHSGAAAAFATLFRSRNVVLTPGAATEPAATARIAELWTACGSRVRALDAAVHDRVFAAVSHLPHVLAFGLVEAFAARDDAEEIFRFAASGFRDFTRIAASSPEMWRDIALANRDALLAEIAAYRDQIDRLAAMIAARDGAGLEAAFARARKARRDWEAQFNASIAAVPDDGPREPEPGSAAR